RGRGARRRADLDRDVQARDLCEPDLTTFDRLSVAADDDAVLTGVHPDRGVVVDRLDGRAVDLDLLVTAGADQADLERRDARRDGRQGRAELVGAGAAQLGRVILEDP